MKKKLIIPLFQFLFYLLNKIINGYLIINLNEIEKLKKKIAIQYIILDYMTEKRYI